MNLLFQVALILIPAAAVIFTVVLFLRKQSERELRNLQLDLKRERQNFFLPNRFESYQRAILLLERIHPNSLVMRLHNPGLPANAFNAELLKAIRDEYDHNVAQQLFISVEGWKMVKDSKEETIRILNLAAKQMDATAMSTDMAAKIFEIVSEIGTLPSEITIEFLKKEFQALM